MGRVGGAYPGIFAKAASDRVHASQFERSTTGPKYEYVTLSSDLWFDFRAGDAVAGLAVIGPAEDRACSTISGSAVSWVAAITSGSGPGDSANTAGSGAIGSRAAGCRIAGHCSARRRR